jgi:hypothetical protein
MINVDLTTKNTVYNTLGPQAQWIQHRFGRRDYPDIELDAELVIKILQDTQDTINFISCYGDPSNYTHVLKVLDQVQPGKCVFNTHLSFDNDQLVTLLNNKHAYVVVPIFGIEDLNNKILLHSDWDLVLKNIKNLTCMVCLEFYTYSFNKHQIDKIHYLFSNSNVEIKIKEGICTHPAGFSTIVNEHGDWLYDAYAKEDKWPELQQTVDGYNSLIQFVKPVKGKSILNNPLVYAIDENIVTDGITSIAVTGDVFPSLELSRNFSNALCKDWTLAFSKITGLDKVTVKEDFKYICSAINKILLYLKQDNNIYRKDFNTILANLTNSNV